MFKKLTYISSLCYEKLQQLLLTTSTLSIFTSISRAFRLIQRFFEHILKEGNNGYL